MKIALIAASVFVAWKACAWVFDKNNNWVNTDYYQRGTVGQKERVEFCLSDDGVVRWRVKPVLPDKNASPQ